MVSSARVRDLSRRDALALLAGAAALAGCAPIEPVAAPAGMVVPSTDTAAAATTARSASAPAGTASRPAAPAAALLTPWLSINGGWSGDTAALPRTPPVAAGPRTMLMQPVGVAARGDVLLIADAGPRVLYRYDRARDTLAPLVAYTGSAADAGASLQLDSDFTAWAALPQERRVVQLDARGRVVRQFRDEANLPRPIAVAVPDNRADVFVADSASPQIWVFDPQGGLRGLMPAQRVPAPSPLQSIAAMVFGPAGLYVLDRLAQQVVVLSPRGEVRAAFGEGRLAQPRALAVDGAGRVFVSDDADMRIHVFVNGEAVAAFGGPGAGPGRFGRIEALCVDGPQLYVADSVNARVQVLLVAPPSMAGRGS